MKLFPGIIKSATEIQDLNVSLELSKVSTMWPEGVTPDMEDWKTSEARKAVKKEARDFLLFCGMLT